MMWAVCRRHGPSTDRKKGMPGVTAQQLLGKRRANRKGHRPVHPPEPSPPQRQQLHHRHRHAENPPAETAGTTEPAEKKEKQRKGRTRWREVEDEGVEEALVKSDSTFVKIVLAQRGHQQSMSGHHQSFSMRIMSLFWRMERQGFWAYVGWNVLMYIVQSTTATLIALAIFRDDFGSLEDWSNVWMGSLAFIWLAYFTAALAARKAIEDALSQFNHAFIPLAARSKRARNMARERAGAAEDRRIGGEINEERRRLMSERRSRVEQQASQEQIELASHVEVVHEIVKVVSLQDPYDNHRLAEYLQDLTELVDMLTGGEQLTDCQVAALENLARQIQGRHIRLAAIILYTAMFVLAAWVGPFLTMSAHDVHGIFILTAISVILAVLFSLATYMHRIDDSMIVNTVSVNFSLTYAALHPGKVDFRHIDIADIEQSLEQIDKEEARQEAERAEREQEEGARALQEEYDVDAGEMGLLETAQVV